MGQSLRLALRTLVSAKAFTAAAVTTLALGIGATTAMFSVTYGVLFRPLSYPDPDRIVLLTEQHAHQPVFALDRSFSNITRASRHTYRSRDRATRGVAV